MASVPLLKCNKPKIRLDIAKLNSHLFFSIHLFFSFSKIDENCPKKNDLEIISSPKPAVVQDTTK